MKATALSPVERGILIILMTHGKPLRQAVLTKDHGLNVKQGNRRKLADLGLIEVEGARAFTYTLTKAGWTWVSQELEAERPMGSMGLGALYATLGLVARLTRKLGLPLHEAVLEDAPSQHAKDGPRQEDNYIREAAWADADDSLARALQDIPVLTSAIDKLKQAVNGTASAELKRTEQSARLVLQSVRQAAAQRELDLAAEPGSDVPFDPSLFDVDGDAVSEGGHVRVRKAAVTRGHGSRRIIIRQGLAEAIPVEK